MNYRVNREKLSNDAGNNYAAVASTGSKNRLID